MTEPKTWEQPDWISDLPYEPVTPTRPAATVKRRLDLEVRPYARPAQVRINTSGNPCRVPHCARRGVA